MHHSRLPLSGESDSDLDHLNLNHLNHLERERPSINRTLTPTNVTGQLGATVYLHCIVHNLGQKTVSTLMLRKATQLPYTAIDCVHPRGGGLPTTARAPESVVTPGFLFFSDR